jgi:uncharacterized LabA/DUF88 family protein
MTDERVMVFIDGQNFFHSMKRLPYITPDMIRINLYKLALLLAKNRKLIRIYYYVGLHAENDKARYHKQKDFLDHIRETPYCSLRYGRLMKSGEGYVEKGVDVLLTVDMLKLARLNSYDTAILISGDGDFVEAVRDAQEMGKQVELATVSYQQSTALRLVCDRYTEISEKILMLASTKRTRPEEMMVVGGIK